MNGKGNSKKFFWEESPGNLNGTQVFITEHNDLGISMASIVKVKNIGEWFSNAQLLDNMELAKMTILGKIAYWYLFQRKVKA